MNIVLMRKVSGFQLSISTGMAMETLFAPRQATYDPTRIPPRRVSLKDYDSLWINVQTLLRNIINATEFTDVRQIRPEFLAEALSQEIEQIQSLCSNEGQGQITPCFFTTTYHNFYSRQGSEYKVRVPETDKQKAWFKTLSDGLTLGFQQGLPIAFKLHPRFNGERVLLMSHLAPDLLEYRDFASMELLESHTGRVKTMREWNTKYSPLGTEKWAHMPWCKPLLCYLGDKYVFAPLSISIRKSILELSKERRWSPMTSSSIVHTDCMTRIKDQNTVKVLRQITVY